MDVFDAINTRRSIRSYTDQPVSDEMVQDIIKAGMLAPSAGNQRPWHFIVIRDQELLAKVPDFQSYAKMVTKAPVSILVCGDPEGKKWPDFWPQDCSAALQNMLLAARGLGLGTVWAGIYPLEERIVATRNLFGIPENVIPFAIMPIGWPKDEFTAKDRFEPELIHHDRW
ncbi:nitroreductase family protein [Desulfosediminicola ganghwensis]|uniref:nitroreductase family protein n=1 Tax=Desulfosediminicola ganghwensis TaxID=2569540 RepID=UPI0010ADA002|nr:nitroreductase family protein [Desulfosediminicola ganghwensis]